MKHLLLSITLFLAVGSVSTPVQAQSTQQITIEKMRFNILKIEKAIKTTKSKIKNIRDAKFLPDLYLSLAEFYVAKSKYMYALKFAENKGIPAEELDFTFEKRLKHQAIEAYDMVIDKFPNFKLRDKAIFLKGHEQRALGLFKEMIITYGQLNKEYPKSEKWAETQIIIGDYFLENKKDVDTALAVYKKVLKRPLTVFTPLAHYKMGWCYVNQRKFAQALYSYERVLTEYKNMDMSSLPENFRKTDVRSEALVAIVWPYSEVNLKKIKPSTRFNRKNALIYFSQLSPNKAAYKKALRKLGRRFSVKKNYIPATKVYFELLRISPAVSDRMDLVDRAYVSMKNTFKDWPMKGYVSEIAKTMPMIRYSEELKKNEKKKAFFDYEIFARDVATRQDKYARRLRTPKEYNAAIKDYELYLSTFNKRKFRAKIEVNLADLYFLSKRFVDSGKAYEAIARKQKSKKQKLSYLDSSLQSYISALKNPQDLSPYELTQSRYGLRSVGTDFIKANPRHKAAPSIIFSIGTSYYDERQFTSAVKALKDYIKRYPKHKDISTAANLILDAYNQVENYKGIVKEGKAILANKNISNGTLKNQLRDIVQQAEMKQVQKSSGDFTSKSYASNLLKMASKYKGTSLGDKALYEAFLAFKAKKDPEAYKVGTQLALKHKNSKYALRVITDMGQMALSSADFKRAALYFELFQERYPKNKEARDLLLSAARMRESMGDYKLAADDYNKLKMGTDAARMDFLGSYWANLARSSQASRGVWRYYWQGLAKYRLKGLGAAKASLVAASKSNVGGPDEREAAAHSLYLLAMDDLEDYKKIQIKLGNEAQAVNEKATGLKALEAKLKKVIQFGNGRWTIAALYGLGQSYSEFSSFLVNSPTPKGLTGGQKKQYRQALSTQAKVYSGSAKKYFSQCTREAEKNKVFTLFVNGCMSKGKKRVSEEQETKQFTRASDNDPSGVKSLRSKLFDQPRDLVTLDKVARLYLKNKDYSMAELVQQRILAISDNKADAKAKIGVIKLYQNQLQEAYSWFEKSLEDNATNAIALYGVAGLYKKFSFKNSYKKARQKAKRSKRPSAYLHPMMKSI